jgi:hypothetical protein
MSNTRVTVYNVDIYRVIFIQGAAGARLGGRPRTAPAKLDAALWNKGFRIG